MNLKSYLMALASVFCLHTLESEATPVKILSYPCGLGDQSLFTKKGSGTLFFVDQKAFVLTSDHVLYHSNNSFCHKILAQPGQATDSVVYSVDFRVGLGLLEVPHFPKNDSSITFEKIKSSQFRSSRPSAKAKVEITGFVSTEEMPHQDIGEIINPYSQRHVFPGVDQLIEVDTYTEFAMSGAGSWSDSGEFIGVLSHQRLSVQTGIPAQLSTTFHKSAAPMAQLNGLIIPGDVVIDWVTHQLTQPFWYNFSAIAQSSGQQAINIAEVKFLLSCDFTQSDSIAFGQTNIDSESVTTNTMQRRSLSDELSSGDGVGVGGHLAFDGSSQKNCKVKLNLSFEEHSPWPFAQGSWLQTVHNQLLRKRTLEIPYFYDPQSFKFLAIPSDLTRVFWAIENGYIPVVTVQLPFGDNSKYLEGWELAQSISQKISTLSNHVTQSHPMSYSLMAELIAAQEFLNSENWYLIRESQINHWLQHPGWVNLYRINVSEDPQLSIRLRSELILLRKSLNDVRILGSEL